MKLRAIEMTNVRRFAGQTVRLSGIGDGITVLSEPNEFGKSTVLDALHALFFQGHRARGRDVASLVPHAGGAPAVAAEIDLPEGRFRIAKRWMGRPMAQVTDAAGRILAQEDAAEDWIARLSGHGLAGPSGLLWVRQGAADLDDRADRGRGLAARRDLLSSVAGEIEAMTGGRRMDGVLARIGAELDRLATERLRPRAHGDWALALAEAADLAARAEGLASDAARLSGDLSRRAEAQARLAPLAERGAVAQRQAVLAAAEAEHDRAQRHAGRIAAAEQALQLADLALAAARAEVARLDALATRLVRAEQALTGAEAALREARGGDADRGAADDVAAATAAADAVRALRLRLDRARRGVQAAEAGQAAARIAAALGQAETVQGRIDAARARRRAILATEARVAAAEAALANRDRLVARAEAQAVAVTLDYHGAARLLQDGRPVAPGRHRLTGPVAYDLPGIGTMRIDPGADPGGAAGQGPGARAARHLAEAEADLQRRLADCGTTDLASARRDLAEALRLDATMTGDAALIAALASAGLDELRTELERARRLAAEASDTTEDPALIEEELQTAVAAETEAQARADRARAAAARAGEARAAAGAALQAARQAVEQAQADVRTAAGDSAALDAARAGAQAAVGLAQVRRKDCAVSLAELRRTAPDLDTAAARLARARSASDTAQAEADRLRHEIVRLDGSIGAMAEEGIEERLDEVRGRLAVAQARAARLGAEVATLDRLRRALEEARAQEREAYFGPVMRELEPLLAILHPGARLQIDDQSLLPVSLWRDGRDEGLEILSGGTREQVAILTRLAFARLFARNGQPVPVILDDALVHSDDDRIVHMFDALHRVARDQQIIVLTCRQRAFRDLGGTPVTVDIETL